METGVEASDDLESSNVFKTVSWVFSTPLIDKEHKQTGNSRPRYESTAKRESMLPLDAVSNQRFAPKRHLRRIRRRGRAPKRESRPSSLLSRNTHSVSREKKCSCLFSLSLSLSLSLFYENSAASSSIDFERAFRKQTKCVARESDVSYTSLRVAAARSRAGLATAC